MVVRNAVKSLNGVVKQLASTAERKLIIPTGGTMGSKPYDNARFAPYNVETYNHDEIVDLVRSHVDDSNVDFYDWEQHHESERLVKDSKLFTEQDLGLLAEIVNRNKQFNMKAILHGTDSVAKNASLFKEIAGDDISNRGDVVAFVSSMVPLSMHNKVMDDGTRLQSDAKNALKYTLDNMAHQEPGVYVVGRDIHTQRQGFFDPESVEKHWFESKARLEFTVHGR